MSERLLEGKKGIILGVANKRSIAWAIAKATMEAGATLAFTYQGEKLKKKVEGLTASFPEPAPLYPCDVTSDEDIARPNVGTDLHDAILVQIAKHFFADIGNSFFKLWAL